MILDAIFSFLCYLPNLLLDGLTSISSFVIPEDTFNWWNNVFYTLRYVFPVWALVPIFTISFTVTGFQIAWAFVLRVKSFVPTMGS